MNLPIQMFATVVLYLNFGTILSLEQINGLKVEKTDVKFKDGIPQVTCGEVLTLRLFGTDLTRNTNITFTTFPNRKNVVCEFPMPNDFLLKTMLVNDYVMAVDMKVPHPDGERYQMYLCAKRDGIWMHQGSDKWVTLGLTTPIVPLWVKILIMCTTLTLSAILSGLSLGIMALDPTELQILAKIGTEKEKKYVNKILPVRKSGTRVLCSLALSNAFVNSLFTVTLDSITGGIVATVVSTLTLSIVAEYLPQAVCVRHGLLIAAHTMYLTKLVMFLTFFVAYPLAKCLTMTMGVQLGHVCTRERLLELIKMSEESKSIPADEVNIISGALSLSTKTVGDAMTKLDAVFMLSNDEILDYDALAEITKTGYSRIPIYEGDKTNIVALLYSKDLAFVDPDDCIPVRVLTDFYNYPCNFVNDDTKLDKMFKIFKSGLSGHLAFVQHHQTVNEETTTVTVGIITLEDVIEEIIQAEIMDETDVAIESYTRRQALQRLPGDYVSRGTPEVSPQLMFAAFQFLSSTVDAFKPDVLSEPILRRLLAQNVVKSIKAKPTDSEESKEHILYSPDTLADYFVLLIEGHVRVIKGNDGSVYEKGPFSYFGEEALKKVQYRDAGSSNLAATKFLPTYTVYAMTDIRFICIHNYLYADALRMQELHRINQALRGPMDVPSAQGRIA